MRTTGEAKRIPTLFSERIAIPEALKNLIWDEPDGYIVKEKLIFRVLERGSFEQLGLTFSQYPLETASVCERYPELPRGAKWWVREWVEKQETVCER